jgi:hypothetical protein
MSDFSWSRDGKMLLSRLRVAERSLDLGLLNGIRSGDRDPPKGVTSVILELLLFASTPFSMKLLSPLRAPLARISWLPALSWVASTISVFVPAVRPRISVKLRSTSGKSTTVS